jgi:hypothetical protein
MVVCLEPNSEGSQRRIIQCQRIHVPGRSMDFFLRAVEINTVGGRSGAAARPISSNHQSLIYSTGIQDARRSRASLCLPGPLISLQRGWGQKRKTGDRITNTERRDLERIMRHATISTIFTQERGCAS